MGRVRTHIKVDGRDFWTLFDTGARNTYVVPEVARLLTTRKLKNPFDAALGGEAHKIESTAILEAEIEGLPVSTHARVIDRIGDDEEGRPIEVIFGAIAMQEWGIHPVPAADKLDVTHYSKEFVEY